jgi:hypothetical protein
MTESTRDERVQKGTLVPNSFQHPNLYVDWLSYYLTAEEEKVLNKAIREILGWQDKIADRRARISLSVFVEGKTARDGHTLCLGCGLSINAVRSCLTSLHKYHVLRKVGIPDQDGQEFELQDDVNAIDWDGLKKRRGTWDKANARRTGKATKAAQKQREATRPASDDDNPYRPTIPISSHDRGIVGRYTPADGSIVRRDPLEAPGVSSDDSKETHDLETHLKEETHDCGASAPLPAAGVAELDEAFPRSGEREEIVPPDGETAGDEALTPEQCRLARAAGLNALANPNGAGVASPVPSQPAGRGQPGDPPWAPAMRRALAGGRGKGVAQLPYGLTAEHIIRVLDRFALLANTTVPTTDASKARGWAKGARDCIEPWAEMVQQAGLPIDPDQVTRLAVWGIDVFFARREAGEFDFTVQSPFSIAGTVRQLTADCKRLQDAAGLLRDQVPEWKESTPDGTPESRKRPGRNGSTRTTGMGGPTAPPIDPDVVARQRQSLLDWQQRKEASDAVAA